MGYTEANMERRRAELGPHAAGASTKDEPERHPRSPFDVRGADEAD